MLHPAPDLSTFARDPVGRYWGGRTWMHWCSQPGLFGVLLWGRPEQEDMQALVASLHLELAEETAAHASLVDARAVESVDPAAFAVLSAYVEQEHAALSQKVEKLALVRPQGMAGAVAAGFYEVLEAPYPVRICQSAALALEWLGEDAGELLSALTEAKRQLSAQGPIVSQLRAILHRDLESSCKAAARILGVSERTLQRRLSEQSTSFQHEMRQARITCARALMRDSSLSLTQIALDCGFGSLQNFSAVFRAELGEAPSAWRKKLGAPS